MSRTPHWTSRWMTIAAALSAGLAATAVWSQTTRPFHRVGAPTNRGGSGEPAGDPADPGVDDSPFTIPAVVPPPRLLESKPLAAEFDLLTRRSIFRKGSQAIARPEDAGVVRAPATTAPAPEASFIFNGVARANDKLVAFFEDGNSHEVLIKHEGDPLAQGKVQHLTLDGLDYVANGTTTHLVIGQDLSGTDQGSALASEPTGALMGDSPDPANESVLDRLRRRRLKELTH